MKWYDYIFIFLAVGVIMVYILFAPGVYAEELQNPLSNSLFALL